MWHMIITEISLTKRWRRKTSLLKFWQKKKKKKKRQHHFEVYRLNHQFWHIDCPAEEQLDVRDKEIQWQVGCVVNLTKTTGNTVWLRFTTTCFGSLNLKTVCPNPTSTVIPPDSLTNSGLLRVAEWGQTQQTSAKLCYDINACLSIRH